MSRTVNYYILLLLVSAVAVLSCQSLVTAGSGNTVGTPVVQASQSPAPTVHASQAEASPEASHEFVPGEDQLVPFVEASPSVTATPVAPRHHAPSNASSSGSSAAAAAARRPIAAKSQAVANRSGHGRTFKMRVVATAYHFDGYGGLTSRGTQVGHGTIAVDPRLIPYYAKIYVPGYGWGRALDCGGAIKGHRIDLWMHSEGVANTWGRRTVEITVVLP